MNINSYPHGDCECTDGCQTCSKDGKRGPAAYLVTRKDGRILNVCTRCTLSSDIYEVLLVTPKDDPNIFFAYDSLGAAIITYDLIEAAKAAEEGVSPGESAGDQQWN